jgi:molybdopterin synthase sulfur carrier subunit
MKLVYFAWVRERIGKAEEEVDLPIAVTTAGELLHWLKSRGEEYENALQYPDVIRVAINQQHVDHAQKLNGAHEVALFPPMTGG